MGEIMITRYMAITLTNANLTANVNLICCEDSEKTDPEKVREHDREYWLKSKKIV